MKPKEYIEQMQSLGSAPNHDGGDLSAPFREYLANSGQNAQELLSQLNRRDWGEMLIKYLGPRLPPPVHEMFESGFISIGAVEDPLPNAYTTRLGDEGYAILFHSGLKNFIYRVARAFSTRVGPKDEAELVSFHETCRIIAEIIWWYQESEQACGPDYPIRIDQIQFASLLSMEAESFLIAHELGHILQGLSAQFGKSLDQQYGPRLDASPVHKEEFHSDSIGLFLVLGVAGDEASSNQDTRSPRSDLSYAGVEFALQIFRAMEVLGFEFEQTHPPASDRLDSIRRMANSKCASEDDWENLSSLARIIDQLFEEVLMVISNPVEHDEFFNRAVMEVVGKLMDLLEHCTGGMVPDYLTFYSQASKIFAKGYSHRLLEEIAKTTAHFLSQMEQMDESKKASQEGWVAFQKYKLFLGLVDQFREPARSVFMNAL